MNNHLKIGRKPSANQKEKIIAEMQDKQENTVRMNVNISKEFYKEIKLIVLKRDTTITNLVINAIEEYISK